MNRKEIKAEAKALVKANWGLCICTTLAATGASLACSFVIQLAQKVLISVFSFIPALGIIVGLLVGLLSFVLSFVVSSIVYQGTICVYYKLAFHKKTSIGDIFLPVRQGYITLAVFVNAIKTIRAVLWSMIPIAGFVLGPMCIFRYWYAPFFLATNVDATVSEVLDYSREFVGDKKGDDIPGNKMSLFIFVLSFIGWWFLGCLTLGILLFIWVVPYMNMAFAIEFRERKYMIEGPEDDDHSKPANNFRERNGMGARTAKQAVKQAKRVANPVEDDEDDYDEADEY